MVANPRRRVHVLDAAVAVLGSSGGRGLTHRAVDTQAGLPEGTTANYFSSRGALMVGLAQRVFGHLAPDADRLAALADLRGHEAVAKYVEYVVERLLARPELPLALIELRLEAARNTEVAAQLAPFLRAGLDADVTFHRSLDLPGDKGTIIGLHHVVNGLVLDRLTVPLDPDADPRRTAYDLSLRLLA